MEKTFFAAPDNPSGGGPPPSNQSYSITISVDQTNGTFTASPQTAEAGTVVTLTATPNAGYEFKASEMKITGASGDRIYTDPSVTASRTYTFTMPGEDVTVTGEFFAVVANVVYVTNTNDSGTGSLRQAIADVQSGGTVQVELPAGSKIELNSSLSGIRISLTIEGNGVTLTRSSTWTPDDTSLLRSGYDLAALTVRRMRFDSAQSTGNGTAIRWDADLTLESCIFSNNTNIGSGRRGAAIYKIQGNAVIKGCTFYNNTINAGSGAVVGLGGGGMTLTLVGNLFYENEASRYPIVGPGFGDPREVQPSYNVLDVDFGTGDQECGWTEEQSGYTDKTLTQLGINYPPIDTTTFVPVSALAEFNETPSTDFPATDFNGDDRNFPGAPGAVNAAP